MKVRQWLTVLAVYVVFHCLSDVFVGAQEAQPQQQPTVSDLVFGSFGGQLLKGDDGRQVSATSGLLPANGQAMHVTDSLTDLDFAAGGHGGHKKLKKHKKKKHGGHGHKKKKKSSWKHHGNYRKTSPFPPSARLHLQNWNV